MRPDWWRGTTPRGLSVPGGMALRGKIRELDASKLPVDDFALLRRVFFEQAHASGIEMLLDDVSLTVRWSQFDRCTFRQRSYRLNAKGIAPQGSFENSPSIYRTCTFAGVYFKTLGRFTTGTARFVNCRFEKCRFNGHFSFSADYISCIFNGRIDGGVWYGAVPPGRADAGRRNVITGNDFTSVTFGPNVGWRDDIDVAAQQWPDDYRPTTEDSR